MSTIDEQLNELQQKIAHKNRMIAKQKELTMQRLSLLRSIEELDAIAYKEQKDVEKLEKTTLSSIFYKMSGKLEEMLSKEEAEAYAARLKLENAKRELGDVENELAYAEGEISRLQFVEHHYKEKLKEKEKAIMESDNPMGEKLRQIEEKLTYIRAQKKEVQEAVQAGNYALSSANQVLKELSDAQGWSTWDMFGGGLVADIAKHDHLDKAQRCVENMQSSLRRFKTELADISIHSDIHVNIEGFTRFADFFFDGIFVDWAIMDKIRNSQSQVQNVSQQISSILYQLQNTKNTIEAEEESLEEERKTIIYQMKI